MADEITRAQAEAEAKAATEALEEARLELEKALVNQSTGIFRDYAKNAESVAQASEAYNEALEASQQAAAVSMEMNQQLTDAITAISNAADEDSLLRSPFEGLSGVEDYVDPLTRQEQKTLDQYSRTLEQYRLELDTLTSLEPFLKTYFESRIDFLESEIDRIQTDIVDPLLAKRSEALLEHQQRVSDAVISFYENQDKNEEVLDTFEQLVDKFEIFETQGLEGLEKKVDEVFERRSREYINSAPEILFVAEYRLEDQLVGALLCFKKFRHSTHYEVFKKNLFKPNSKFQRILFLHRKDLKEETENFVPYIRDVLGFTDINFDDVYIILDTQIKNDRIYEYKVSAAKVPSLAEKVDYDLILESKDLLNQSTISDSSNATLFSWSGVVLGSNDLAWVLSVVNEGITFFGRAAAEQSLRGLIFKPKVVVGGVEVLIPKNINDVLYIIQNSVSLLGARNTVEHIVNVLGGLPSEFVEPLLSSVDEDANTFSYESFRELLKTTTPVFQLVLEIAETQDTEALDQLSQMSISLPMNEGTESLTTILGLSNVFKFINDTFISVTYSQENSSFQKLTEIRALIEINREREESLEEAVSESREDAVLGQAEGVTVLYETPLGNKSVFEDPTVHTAAGGIVEY